VRTWGTLSTHEGNTVVRIVPTPDSVTICPTRALVRDTCPEGRREGG
jgi:hypothetical protein